MELTTTLGSNEADIRTSIDEIGKIQDDGTVLLTLDQAITLALQRNLTVAVQRYQRDRSIMNILGNKGIYDLQLDATLLARSESSPPRSVLEEADIIVDDTTIANTSLTQLVPFGGTVRLDYNNSEFETSNQAFVPNPRFDIDLDLVVTQPLLRNFGRDVTERNLVVARTNVAISREDFQLQVEATLQQVIDGYWSLVEARQQLAVAEESLALAKDLDRINRIQVRVGTLAALEVIQSEAGVAARMEDIILRQTQVEDAADFLRGLTNLERTDAWDKEIVPATEPETADPPQVDLKKAIATAHEFRPDLRRLRLQQETLELDARVARNQKRPRLDLSARYGFNAVDGDQPGEDADGNPVLLSRGYSDAFEQITNGDFEGWQVSLQVGYPLQNRTAKAISADARLAVDQGELSLRELELQIRTEVRSAARALEAAAQRVETAGISSALAQQSLEAEEKRYQNGLSTSFAVLQFQEDLSEARSREVSATINHRRAETSYYRSVGQLLEHYDVVLADDE